MRIKAEDTMALVIDFQERLIPVIYNNEKLLKNTEILLEGFNILEIPTIITQQYTKGLGMTVEEIKNIYHSDFEYLEKLTFSSYNDKNIKEIIDQQNKKNIIICGIEAHICVLQTVIDCKEAGYQVIVVEDCISSRKENDKAIALQRFQHEGVIITTYESILFELTRIAGNNKFKAISKLIK